MTREWPPQGSISKNSHLMHLHSHKQWNSKLWSLHSSHLIGRTMYRRHHYVETNIFNDPNLFERFVKAKACLSPKLKVTCMQHVKVRMTHQIPNRNDKGEKKNFVYLTIVACRRLKVQHLVLWNALPKMHEIVV